MTRQSHNHASRYLSRGNEIWTMKRHLHPHIHCIIHNSQDVETI